MNTLAQIESVVQDLQNGLEDCYAESPDACIIIFGNHIELIDGESAVVSKDIDAASLVAELGIDLSKFSAKIPAKETSKSIKAKIVSSHSKQRNEKRKKSCRPSRPFGPVVRLHHHSD